jgi:hypothetical protein
MKKQGISAKLRWAALNQPTLIPSIVNDKRLNKRLSTRILHDMIPRRTSIEIEATNSLATALNAKPTSRSHKYWGGIMIEIYGNLAKQYNVLEFAIDDRGSTNTIDYDEHKISIKNYTQLKGLYLILEDMKKHCLLTTNSGCHIHLDITKLMKESNFNIERLADFLTTKCRNGSIEKIFGEASSYMKDEELMKCSIIAKGTWICINDKYKSIEFRCGFMTFDYSTIVKWYIEVNKILNEYERTLPTHSQKESPKEVYEAEATRILDAYSITGSSRQPNIRVVGRIQL